MIFVKYKKVILMKGAIAIPYNLTLMIYRVITSITLDSDILSLIAL